jgi:hypothetical protein
MKLTYRYNKGVVGITEAAADTDVEFDIRVLSEELWPGMKKVQRFFEDNRVYTDVLFYAYADHHYRVIVRQDYYADFILSLLKHRLVESAEWVE